MIPLPQADLEHVLEEGRQAWAQLEGANLLVTGATGFFGAWLLESLHFAKTRLGLDLQLAYLSRNPQAFRTRHPHLASFQAIQGDIRSFRMNSGVFTHVVHGATAASAVLNNAAPEEMFSTIVDGTRNLLANLTDYPPHRFLMISSGAVYGVQPREIERVPESFRGGPDPLDPGSAYAEGKRAAELMATLWARRQGVSLVTARPFAFVGPGLPLDIHFAAGNFLRDGLAGGPIRIQGDGTPMRSYLHVADLAVWLWRLLVSGEPGTAYNVGSDEAVSIGDLAREVGSLTGSGVHLASNPVPGQLPSRYVPDISRARDLGLRVAIGRRDAFARTLNWLKRSDREAP